jgi:hypothetical protein
METAVKREKLLALEAESSTPDVGSPFESFQSVICISILIQ